MYGLSKRTFPPTAIDHCVTATFTSPTQTNLIVAKTSRLEIYALRANLKPEEDARSRVARLDLIAEHNLFGNIKSLAVVRLPNRQTDCLIASFEDAKISVVEWDPQLDDIRVKSLHYYENDADLKDGRVQFLCPQLLRVDYENRCAVCLIYDRKLAVLPFISSSLRQQPTNKRSDRAQGNESFIIDLPAIGISHIKDFVFLHGYYEPTLMFLYEPVGTWVGRWAKRRNTHSVSIVTLNVLQKQHTSIWSCEHLPADAQCLAALPNPVGGSIVFCTNSILYLNQSSKLRMTLNWFGDKYAADDPTFITEKSKSPLTMDCVRHTMLDPENMLVCLRNGDLWVLGLHNDGRSLIRMELQRAGTAVPATCVCVLTEELLFLGSRVGDSLLLKYFHKDADGGVKTKKKRKTVTTANAAELQEADFIDPKDIDEDVKDLVNLMFQSKATRKNEAMPKWGLQVCDSLSSASPIGDITICRSLDEADRENAEESALDHRLIGKPKKLLEIVACSGQNKSGALTVIQNGIRPVVVTSLELPSCQAMWALYSREADNSFSADPETGRELHQYLFLSRADSTMVLQTGEALEEVTDMDFPADQATINVGNVLSNTRIVHVYEKGIFLLNGIRAVDQVKFGESKAIWSSISDPYVAVLLEDRSICVYVASDANQRLEKITSTPIRGGTISTITLFYDQSSISLFNRWSAESSNSRYTKIRDRIRSKLSHSQTSIGLSGQVPNGGDDSRLEASMDIDNGEQNQATIVETDPEELMLYGSSTAASDNASRRRKHKKRKAGEANLAESAIVDDTGATDDHGIMDADYMPKEDDIVRPTFCAVCRIDGSMEARNDIYSLPEFALVWRTSGVNIGKHILRYEAPHTEAFEDPLMKPVPPVQLAFDDDVDVAGDFFDRMDEDGAEENLLRVEVSCSDGKQSALFFPRSTKAQFLRMMELGQFVVSHVVMRRSEEMELTTQSKIMSKEEYSSADPNEFAEQSTWRSGAQSAWDPRHPVVVEVAMVCLGSSHLLPHLVVLLDNGDLLLYRGFKLVEEASPTLPLRFKRLEHNVLCRNFKTPSAPTGFAKRRTDGDSDSDDEEETKIISTERHRWTHSRIVQIAAIEGRRGAFISGMRPIWILAERDYARTFKMDIDGAVSCFTEFNNINCPDGFVYYASQSQTLKISQMKPMWSYEHPLPTFKVPLKATPRSIVYDGENEALVVMVSSTVKDNTRYLRPPADDKKDDERARDMKERGIDPDSIKYNESDVDPRMPAAYEENYEIRTISPETWETHDTYPLQHEETGVVHRLTLRTQEKEGGDDKMLQFIVVPTLVQRGEEAAAKGRIMVFQLQKESTAEHGPQAKLNFLCEREEKGALSYVASVNGTLVSAVGPKLWFYHLRHKAVIDPVGFHDAQFVVSSIRAVKNYIMFSDMYKSICFVRWRERVKSIDPLGKDTDVAGIFGIEAVIDGDKLSFVISDDMKNLHVYTYAPLTGGTQRGQRLLNVSNFHLGSHVQDFIRVKVNRLNFSGLDQPTRYLSYYGSFDGALGFVIPVSAEKFKRLGKLEMRLNTAIPHAFGLNPKAFRLFHNQWKQVHNHNRRMMDGDLLWKFPFLDRNKQDECAALLGVNPDDIMDSLMELELATEFC